MVVEDEVDLRRFVEDVLMAEGFRVVAASNGQEALQQVDREPPDVILLDMRLPVMDGWQFAKELHAKDHDQVAIVVMTALGARDIARQIGAQAYLQKPFNIDDLIKIVKTA
jgi:urea transport system substrate-binding protein